METFNNFKIRVFWSKTPFQLVNILRHLDGMSTQTPLTTYTLKTKVVGSSEKSATTSQHSRRHNPKDVTLH